jgi:uncharacterized membrane protein
MTSEQINQIIETIKTLNINVDSQTLERVVNSVKSLLWFIYIKSFIINVLWVVLIFGIAYLIYRFFKITASQRTKENVRKSITSAIDLSIVSWNTTKNEKGEILINTKEKDLNVYKKRLVDEIIEKFEEFYWE